MPLSVSIVPAVMKRSPGTMSRYRPSLWKGGPPFGSKRLVSRPPTRKSWARSTATRRERWRDPTTAGLRPPSSLSATPPPPPPSFPPPPLPGTLAAGPGYRAGPVRRRAMMTFAAPCWPRARWRHRRPAPSRCPGAKNVPELEPAFAEQTRAPEALSGVELAVEKIAGGWSIPGAWRCCPTAAMLVTERPGRLRVVGADGACRAGRGPAGGATPRAGRAARRRGRARTSPRTG